MLPNELSTQESVYDCAALGVLIEASYSIYVLFIWIQSGQSLAFLSFLVKMYAVYSCVDKKRKECIKLE